MKINSTIGANTQMGMNQATDSYSRNIQNQIANAQKQLQELSSNDTSIKQAKVQGSVGVLESEIKNNHGSDVTKKKEELADVTQKAQAVTYTHVDVRL